MQKKYIYNFKKSLKNKVLTSKIKRKVLKNVLLIRILLILGVIVIVIFISSLTISYYKKSKLPYYSKLVSQFIFSPDESIDSINDRVNFLILGKGGGSHEAPDLTDTIIFVSLDLENNKISQLSIPRDLWIDNLRTKVNSVYYYGNQKSENGGLILSKITLEEILGEPISYILVLDFEGFEKIINALGGVDVYVENSFVDEKYPIEGRENDLCDSDPEFKCRYETVSFTKGQVFMDGETALKYVRSRNSSGDEGTDFARGKRQEKVIEAVKDKILSKDFILSPRTILEVKDILKKYIETDINPYEAAALSRRFFTAKDNVYSFSFQEDLLENPPRTKKYDNLYVLVPKEDWQDIQNWVSCILSNGNCK